jgi:hypothetical protein
MSSISIHERRWGAHDCLQLDPEISQFQLLDDMIMMDENLLLSNNQPSNVGMCISVVSSTKSNMS